MQNNYKFRPIPENQFLAKYGSLLLYVFSVRKFITPVVGGNFWDKHLIDIIKKTYREIFTTNNPNSSNTWNAYSRWNETITHEMVTSLNHFLIINCFWINTQLTNWNKLCDILNSMKWYSQYRELHFTSELIFTTNFSG